MFKAFSILLFYLIFRRVEYFMTCFDINFDYILYLYLFCQIKQLESADYLHSYESIRYYSLHPVQRNTIHVYATCY